MPPGMREERETAGLVEFGLKYARGVDVGVALYHGNTHIETLLDRKWTQSLDLFGCPD